MAEWCSPGRYVHGQEAIDRRLKFLTMNREMLSPAYTTRWKELPVARF
ncbi:DUF4113 domain-containing protein [Klebsiella quasipneumoniae]|nr:DUF4113 domain-containing protein [Klebsiella variicola]